MITPRGFAARLHNPASCEHLTILGTFAISYLIQDPSAQPDCPVLVPNKAIMCFSDDKLTQSLRLVWGKEDAFGTLFRP